MIRFMGEPDSMAREALVIGCGFLGQVLAGALMARGVTVYATTRREERARELAERGVRALIVDVLQPVTFAALRPALASELLDVYCLLPPGRMADQGDPARDPALRGLGNVLDALEGAWIHRAIMVSSTAVYSHTAGRRVDADTAPVPTPAPDPGNDRAARLLRLERLWLDGGAPFRVLRLAGLYGPGRIVGLEAVRGGHPLVGDAEAMLNLIHVEDAAELLIAFARADEAHAVELGSDGSPTPRLAYYTELARRVGVSPPEVVDDETAALELGLNLDRLRRASSKRCDPEPTCARTGWRPRYRDFRMALDELLPQRV